MSELVQITLHGKIGEEVGKSWRLAVESVSEAIHAINILGKQKLNKFLLKPENGSAHYRVLINGDDFIAEKPLDKVENYKDIDKSNLIIPLKNLKTIDIVPVVEGANADILNFLQIIIGVVLIVVGIAAIVLTGGIGTMGGIGLIMIGAGLLIGGIMGLLAKPPAFEDFRDIEGGKKVSYLFNGPENVTREGGPVPVGYGRLLVGSQVIAASYNTYDVESDEGEQITAVSVNGGSSTENADATVPAVKP